MKKLTLALVIAIVASTLAFAAGQQDGGSASAEGVVVNPAGVWPVVNETVTLSAFISQNGASDDFENNLFTEFMEENTNVRIDWNVASAADYETKLNLIVASGEFPDMFIHAPWTLAQLQILGADGVLHPLNDLIDEYGETSKVIYERFPRLERILTHPDGNIYAMPAITGAFHAQAQKKMWVYTAWMDKLGIETPETTEDLYDMLMAFKTEDPNGNGREDEVPLAGAVNGWASQLDGYLMGSFIYNDGTTRMRYLNGKITVSYDKPEWREGLRYIKRLYDAGLIAPESFTQTADQLKQLGENTDIAILGAAPGGYQGVFTQVGGESGRWLEYRTIPPVEGPQGVRTTHFIADMGLTDRIAELAISTQCDYPAVAFRYGEFMYTMEATRFADGGVEGEHWEYVPEGTLATDGTNTALFRSLMPKPINVSWGNITPRYGYFMEYHNKQAASPNDLETILYEDTANNYMPYVPPADHIVPILAFAEGEANEIADMESQLVDYVDEMVARFVTGDADLDDDWSSYLRELDNIGLPRYIELYQKAYDTNMR